MSSIVYQIVNIQTGKFLVGSTSNEIIRMNNHFSSLRRKQHDNKYLQHAYNKYGRNTFDFQVIKRYDTAEEAIGEEQIWLDRFCGNRIVCYNINPNADKGGSFLGYKHTPESKQKISKSLKDNGCNKGINNPCYGRTGTKNPRAKLNEFQVRIIRWCFKFGISNTFIASIFKVKQSAISKIKTGQRWPQRGTRK